MTDSRALPALKKNQEEFINRKDVQETLKAIKQLYYYVNRKIEECDKEHKAVDEEIIRLANQLRIFRVELLKIIQGITQEDSVIKKTAALGFDAEQLRDAKNKAIVGATGFNYDKTIQLIEEEPAAILDEINSCLVKLNKAAKQHHIIFPDSTLPESEKLNAAIISNRTEEIKLLLKDESIDLSKMTCTGLLSSGKKLNGNALHVAILNHDLNPEIFDLLLAHNSSDAMLNGKSVTDDEKLNNKTPLELIDAILASEKEKKSPDKFKIDALNRKRIQIEQHKKISSGQATKQEVKKRPGERPLKAEERKHILDKYAELHKKLHEKLIETYEYIRDATDPNIGQLEKYLKNLRTQYLIFAQTLSQPTTDTYIGKTIGGLAQLEKEFSALEKKLSEIPHAHEPVRSRSSESLEIVTEDKEFEKINKKVSALIEKHPIKAASTPTIEIKAPESVIKSEPRQAQPASKLSGSSTTSKEEESEEASASESLSTSTTSDKKAKVTPQQPKATPAQTVAAKPDAPDDKSAEKQKRDLGGGAQAVYTTGFEPVKKPEKQPQPPIEPPTSDAATEPVGSAAVTKEQLAAFIKEMDDAPEVAGDQREPAAPSESTSAEDESKLAEDIQAILDEYPEDPEQTAQLLSEEEVRRDEDIAEAKSESKHKASASPAKSSSPPPTATPARSPHTSEADVSGEGEDESSSLQPFGPGAQPFEPLKPPSSSSRSTSSSTSTSAASRPPSASPTVSAQPEEESESSVSHSSGSGSGDASVLDTRHAIPVEPLSTLTPKSPAAPTPPAPPIPPTPKAAAPSAPPAVKAPASRSPAPAAAPAKPAAPAKAAAPATPATPVSPIQPVMPSAGDELITPKNYKHYEKRVDELAKYNPQSAGTAFEQTQYNKQIEICNKLLGQLIAYRDDQGVDPTDTNPINDCITKLEGVIRKLDSALKVTDKLRTFKGEIEAVKDISNIDGEFQDFRKKHQTIDPSTKQSGPGSMSSGSSTSAVKTDASMRYFGEGNSDLFLLQQRDKSSCKTDITFVKGKGMSSADYRKQAIKAVNAAREFPSMPLEFKGKIDKELLKNMMMYCEHMGYAYNVAPKGRVTVTPSEVEEFGKKIQKNPKEYGGIELTRGHKEKAKIIEKAPAFSGEHREFKPK